jgi:GYF domain 2
MSHTDSNMIWSFIVLFIIAGFTAYYAQRKGRSPLLWFIIGILLGVIAPFILLFLPIVKKEHDSGVPTIRSQPDPLLQMEQPPPAPIELKRQEENKLWFYLDQNHQQIGPVSVVALRELWNRGMLELNNYVWTEGMKQWEKVDNLPELKGILSKQ